MEQLIVVNQNSSESPDSVIETFKMRLEENELSNFVEVDLTPKGRHISLDRIYSTQRCSGYSSRVLKILISLCDEHKMDIILIPHPLEDEFGRGMSNEQLENWYSRNDFLREGNATEMRRRFRNIT
jgi:hypothetical protein